MCNLLNDSNFRKIKWTDFQNFKIFKKKWYSCMEQYHLDLEMIIMVSIWKKKWFDVYLRSDIVDINNKHFNWFDIIFLFSVVVHESVSKYPICFCFFGIAVDGSPQQLTEAILYRECNMLYNTHSHHHWSRKNDDEDDNNCDDFIPAIATPELPHEKKNHSTTIYFI